MSDRKLASIERIGAVEPIENADRLEMVKVRGWWCVAGKGEFKPGDPCVYFEIDSFLPVEARYEFLRKRCLRKMRGEEGHRIKTAKFRGRVSQGLALPLDEDHFPEIRTREPGTDVTKLLGVKLWEEPVPACLDGEVIGPLPHGIPHYDQERAQNLVEQFSKWRDLRFESTVKMNGSNCCVYFKDNELGVCGRNWEWADTEKNSYWKVAKDLELGERLGRTGRNLALRGELVGEGIQKNPDKIKGQDLFIFDVYDFDRKSYLWPEERRELIDEINDFGPKPLRHVRYLGTAAYLAEPEGGVVTIDTLLEMAKGPGMRSEVREGVVFKACENDQYPQGLSFKVINNDYLTKVG